MKLSRRCLQSPSYLCDEGTILLLLECLCGVVAMRLLIVVMCKVRRRSVQERYVRRVSSIAHHGVSKDTLYIRHSLGTIH